MATTKQEPEIGGLPAHRFIRRTVRFMTGGQPSYPQLVEVNGDMAVISNGRGGRQTVRVSELGPNFSRNTDLQIESKEKRARANALNPVEKAFETVTVIPKSAPVPVVPDPPPVVETPPPTPVTLPEPVAETSAPEAPAPPKIGRKLLSFQAPPDTDFSWTGDMQELNKALKDQDELEKLLLEAKATVDAKAAAVTAKGVVLVWDRPMTKPVPAAAGEEEEDHREEITAWVQGAGKLAGEFSVAQAMKLCGKTSTRSSSAWMAAELTRCGYTKIKVPGTQILTYRWGKPN